MARHRHSLVQRLGLARKAKREADLRCETLASQLRSSMERNRLLEELIAAEIGSARPEYVFSKTHSPKAPCGSVQCSVCYPSGPEFISMVR